MKDQIKNYLTKLVIIVKHLEKDLVNKYNAKGILYNEVGKTIPREGTLIFFNYSVFYKFHGAGCLFKINDLELDYNMAPISDNNIKISPWNFLNFLKTCSNVEDDIKSLDQGQIFNILIEFEKLGILHKTPESMGSFEVCESWIGKKLSTSDSIEIILKSVIARF
jgi:hypothetical protein